MNLLRRKFLLSVALFCLSIGSKAQLSGSYTIPSTQFPTLKSIIDSLNVQGISASVTVNFTPATGETAPTGGYRLGSATLNANLSAAKTLTINGNGNNITAFVGTSNADGIFWIAGADYVTINNLNLLESSANTTSTTMMEYGYALVKLSSTAPYDGCQYDLISGCSITLNYLNAASYGILLAHYLPGTNTILSTSGVTNASLNSYNRISGCTISSVNYGIRAIGISTGATTYDKGNVYGGVSTAQGNSITVGGGTTKAYAIFPSFDSVITIKNNNYHIASGHNAKVYEVLMGNGYGDLNISYNTFDLNCSMATDSVYAYYNYGASGGHGDTLGGLSSQSIHTISNNTFSGNNPVATSSSLYNIYENYAFCRTLNIQNNSITNENWNLSIGTIYGIYLFYNYSLTINVTNNYTHNIFIGGQGGGIFLAYCYADPSPTGVFSYKNNTYRKITANNYVIHSIYGSSSIAPTGYLSCRLIDQYNTIDSVDMSGATGTNYFTNTFGYNGGDSSTISYNTFSNIKMSNTSHGHIYNNTNGYYGPNQYIVRGNTFKNFNGFLIDINNYLGVYATICDSNTIDNITSIDTGASTVFNMLAYYMSGTCSNNRVNNVNLGGGSMYNYVGYFGNNPSIHHNAITNITIGGASSNFYNYMGYFANGANIYNNRIDSITMGGATNYPWYSFAQGGDYNIYNNIISNITTTNSTISLYPFYLSGNGVNVNFYNNFLTKVNFPANYSGSGSAGISLVASNAYKLYNNTVYLKPGITGGPGYGLTGILYTSVGTLDLRNNIINVDAIPNGGYVCALRRSSGTTGVNPGNFLPGSNGNIYYTPNVTNAYLYGEGSSAPLINTFNLINDANFNTPCGLFKTFVGQNNASFTENNLIPASLPATYVPTGTTFAEKGGVPTTTPAVTTDFANISRGSYPDMGALEFSGTNIDKAPPAISYTPITLNNFCITGPTLVASISDISGVAAGPTTAPRLYFKKSTENNVFGGSNNNTYNGWKYVNASSISGNSYTFNFDYSLLTSTAGPGDSITYFIIAQDSASSPNTGTTIGSFAFCPTTVALSSTNGGNLKSLPQPNGFSIINPPNYTFSAYPPNVCFSGSAIIYISPLPVGVTIQWQTASLTGAFTDITGATGGSIITGTLTSSQRYRVQLYCGSTVLTSSPIDTFVVSNPAIISATGYTHCGYGTGPLTVTTSPFATANWYNTTSGGSPIFSGNTFTPPPSSNTKTYYVAANNPIGSTEIVTKSPPASYSYTLSAFGIVMVFDNASTNLYSSTVYPIGSGVISVDLYDSTGYVYTAGPFAVTGSSGVSSPNVLHYGPRFLNLHKGRWFLEVNPTYTGTPYLNYEYGLNFPINSPSGKVHIVGGCYNGSENGYGSYYFFFYDNVISGDCEAPSRTPVTLTSTPATSTIMTATKLPGICMGDYDTLVVNSANLHYQFSWSTNPVSGYSAYFSNPILPIAPTSTTTYYVLATDPYSGCSSFDSLTIYVNPQPAAPSISPNPASLCSGNYAHLQVAAPPGLQGSAVVGSDTTANTITTYPTPYGAYHTGNHIQYMFTAAELYAAGVTPGNITSLAFDQSAGYIGGPMGNFKILIATLQASTTNLTGFVNPTGGWTSVFNAASYSPPNVAGWVSYPISPFFYWNGTSPIIIDVQHMNCSSCPTASCNNYTHNGTVYFSPTAFNSVVYYYADNDCSVTSFSPTSYTVSPNRANMRFNYPKPSPINWLNVGNMFKNPGLTNPVSFTDSANSVYVSPSTNTIYRAVANVQGCRSAPASDTVIVTPSPLATISPSGPDTICTGSSLTFCLPGSIHNSYQWYLNNTLLVGANASCYSATTSGTYSCVVTDLTTGCMATSSGAVLVVNPVPVVTISSKNALSFCNGGGDSLVASNAPGYSYQWLLNGVSISGATGLQYIGTASGTYTVLVTNPQDCSAISSGITLTNNSIPLSISSPGSLIFCSGGSIALSGPSMISGITYQWYNGATAISGATTNTYTATASGNYYLKASNPATGCIDTSNHLNVISGSPPPASIIQGASATYCVGGNVHLKTNPSPGLMYQWYLNGTAISGANDSIYVANAAGSYTVNVAITGTPACNATTAIPTVVSVIPLPAATVTSAGPTTFCQGANDTLNAPTGTGFGYQWKLNGISIVSGGNASSYTAISGGNYTVTVTNLLTGCSNTSGPAITITVNPIPSVAIAANGPSTFCAGDSVILNSSVTSPGYNLVWKNNGTVLSGQTATMLTAKNTGLYTVTAINPLTACQATSAVVSVQVNALPSDTTTPTGSNSICQNTTLSLSAVPIDTNMNYQWKLNGSVISSATGGTYGAYAAGTYNLVVTNKHSGCPVTSPNIIVSLMPAPIAAATVTGNTIICQGDSTQLVVNLDTGQSYQWKLNGSIIVGANDTVYNAKLPGNYTVAVTNSTLCTTLSNGINITVYPRPPAYITYNTSLSFCAGDTVVLQANAGTGLIYQWLLNGTMLPNNGMIYVADSSGYYTLQVANTYNCMSTSAPVNVTVYPTPLPAIANSGMNLQTATTYLGYQWFYNTTPIGGANSYSYSYTSNGVYQVYVVDSNGCVGYSTQIIITNVGITNPALGNSIRVYPNPTSGVINIDAKIAIKISLRDVTGKAVFEASNVKSIALGDIASGTYLLFITDLEGHLLRTEKVTKRND